MREDALRGALRRPPPDFAPLATDLVTLLEEKIVTRRHAPGSRLIEAELCERHGISRTPLREALRTLEAGGLVVRRPRYGVRVAPMTLENLDHVYACRVPLEALAAAALAASPAREGAVARIGDCLSGMERALRQRDLAAAFTANVALTGRLHAECGNPVLAGLLAQLDKPALRYRHWAYLEDARMPPLAIRANRAMLAAIAAGDPARAEAVVRDLITGAWHLMREAVAARPDAFDAPRPSAPDATDTPRRGPGRPRRTLA